MPASRPPLFESALTSLPLVGRGKVRDIYAVDDEHLLIVASDRLSAFDVVLPDPIPGKGEVLTAISNFWFGRTEHIVPNHLTGRDPATVVATSEEREQVLGRSVVVRRLRPLPLEAVVRAYLIGSGWREYQETGAVCGISLPAGLRQADRLPEVIFTPSTKAPSGSHDMNVDFEAVADAIGRPLAGQVRDVSIEIFRQASEYAATRGIIIADTKMEFGLDDQDRLVLIDELLTPDSSRFWPADTYAPGTSPPSFDKQFVRDYLETLAWDKTPPAPSLPPAVIQGTASKYRQACELLTGDAPG